MRILRSVCVYVCCLLAFCTAAIAQGDPDLRSTLSSLRSKTLQFDLPGQPYHLRFNLVVPVQHNQTEYGFYDRDQSDGSAATLVQSLGSFQDTSTFNGSGNPVAIRSGPPPLVLVEFGLAFPIPQEVLFGRVGAWHIGSIHHQQSTETCFVSSGDQFFCLDKVTGLPLSLSLGGTHFAYGEWTDFNGRLAPLHVVISYKKRTVLDATGLLEHLQTLQPIRHLASESPWPYPDDCGPRHLLRGWPVSMVYGPSSGFVQLGLKIDPKGRVQSARVLGSDDRKLEASAVDGTHLLQYNANPAQTGLCSTTTLYRGTLDLRDPPSRSESSLTELSNPNR